jgi:F-type H+-transporting ATPase subunit epsilon
VTTEKPESLMATFQFDLVSPEEILFSGEVEHVVVPGTEGEFGVLAGHAPMVAMLRPGILRILGLNEQRILVVGGFAEVGPEGLTVLADRATPIEDVDPADIAAEIQDIEEDIADTTDEARRDRLRTKLDQLKAVQEALGH